MHSPLISVVIPVWNEEERIERAMRSIMNQTYTNLEIIVVDDDSNDNTLSVAKRVALEDSRVTVLSYAGDSSKRTNWRGYDISAGALARAYGFARAKGHWITTQDADDSSLLNRIEVQHSIAEKYHATMVCVDWQQATPETAGKRLDTERIMSVHGGEEVFLVRPEVITPIPDENLGILMRLPFNLHRFIPFPFKWFPYTRFLFYGKRTHFIGADNCMLFSREVIEKGVNFRARNDRKWGVPSGRGSGRDFVMSVTHTFKNTWTLKLPLYLWDVRTPNPVTPAYSSYLVD